MSLCHNTVYLSDLDQGKVILNETAFQGIEIVLKLKDLNERAQN